MICSGEYLFRAINLPPYEVFRPETNIIFGPVFGGQVSISCQYIFYYKN
jgi:hypothetical protein